MQGKLIRQIGLENGLTLELFDGSRPVTKDRWLVSFSARIEVEVKREYFEGTYTADFPFEDLHAKVGAKAVYLYEKTRNVIADAEKDTIFNGLKERFLNASIAYLSRPDFPRKLILRKYQEAQAQGSPWKRH